MKQKLVALLLALSVGLTLLSGSALAVEAEESAEAVVLTEEPVVSDPAEEPGAAAAQPEDTDNTDNTDNTGNTDNTDGTDSTDGTPTEPTEEPTEEDTEEPAWVVPALRQAHVRYMEGFPGGVFYPEQTLTRAQTAQMIYRLLASPDSGTGSCSYGDVPANEWYAKAVTALCALGLFDDGTAFYPDAAITRAAFVDALIRLRPEAVGEASFSDVPADHWAAQQIGAAVSLGWLNGYPDGTFQPEGSLTRAEACTIINRMTGRTGDTAQAEKLLTLGLFSDVTAEHWAARAIAEASVAHTPTGGVNGEVWTGVSLADFTFQPGFHEVGQQLYYVDRAGKLAVSTTVGAYQADAAGALTLTSWSYRMANVPYYSQIDNLYAWVGCESVATFTGLKAKGYAQGAELKRFVTDQPRSSSDPEKGFVGDPFVPDKSKRTRTTIYPAKLAEYSNTYCGSLNPCEDFRGASITDLQRELLAGNCVVGYMTLWWATPSYRNYNIEGTTQRLVSNNHAVLVCGYDKDKGYFISDPYNYYNRGRTHQYWERADVFEAIWNERKVGMVIR